jgi:hypothetical protein
MAMTLTRLGLIIALALGGASGCEVGGPERASDIQNLNGISDDIAAVSYSQSDTRTARDPNLRMPVPRTYQTNYQAP